MVGLDYFLNKNWIKRNKKELDNDHYIAKVFTTTQKNLNFSFSKQIANDRYLFDYAKAFSIPQNSLATQELRIVEIFSLLMIDGDLEEHNPKKIRRAIIEINDGRKPKNRDERKIWNLIEALDLIKTEKFEINEDNYELLIHIMFRNLGYNLDIKEEFYRNSPKKNQFKNLLDASSIDEELKSLIHYVHNLDHNDFSGFTQSLIIFLAFIYISPYQRNNVLLGLLVSRWYLYTLESKEVETLIPSPIYSLAFHWKHFINLTNLVFSEDLNINELTKFLLKCALDEVNFSYRLNALENWIDSDTHINQHLFVDGIDKIVILNLLGMQVESWKINKVMQNFKNHDYYIFSRKEVEDVIERLASVDIFKKVEKDGVIVYQLNNPQLLKIQMVLQD